MEFSRDGENFSFLARRDGQGTSTEAQVYTYVHENVTRSATYYRLKQVDEQGSFTYSEVLYFESSCYLNNGVLIRPIPVKGTGVLTLDFYADPNESYEVLNIFNASGMLMKTITLPTVDRGVRNTLQISTDGLSSGVYILQGLGREVGRFIVI